MTYSVLIAFLKNVTKKALEKNILIMGKYTQTFELSTNFSYALYHVLANRFNVC